MIIFVALNILLDLLMSFSVCLHHKLAVEYFVTNFTLEHLFTKSVVFKLFLILLLLLLRI